jgi:hypothetical protein
MATQPAVTIEVAPTVTYDGGLTFVTRTVEVAPTVTYAGGVTVTRKVIDASPRVFLALLVEAEDPTEFAAVATVTLVAIPEEIEIELVKQVSVVMPAPVAYDKFGRPVQ